MEFKPTEISISKMFGGYNKRYKHYSPTLGCSMNFHIFFPPSSSPSLKFPVLYWLSGLTCTDENFIAKSGAQRAASSEGVALIVPDTSPRGLNVEGESDSWDFGVGAGFYLNATQEKWKNWKMYDYVVKELPTLLHENFPELDTSRASIFGHSMGAATLKARTLKEVWNIAAVIPVDKGMGSGNGGGSNGSSSGELIPEENFLGICSRELLARGGELLKRTRKGDLHWKIVSVYINRTGQVMLKMKSRHVAGTITKKKKNLVLEVMKDIPAWPGRHLLPGSDNFRYFALKTVLRGVVEFECRDQREYDLWTQGVSRLLSIAAEKNSRHKF